MYFDRYKKSVNLDKKQVTASPNLFDENDDILDEE